MLLVQLDSVAFLAITSTRTMAFSGIMSQECAAKWLLSVLVRLGIFISSSCPFFKMYTFVFLKSDGFYDNFHRMGRPGAFLTMVGAGKPRPSGLVPDCLYLQC